MGALHVDGDRRGCSGCVGWCYRCLFIRVAIMQGGRRASSHRESLKRSMAMRRSIR